MLYITELEALFYVERRDDRGEAWTVSGPHESREDAEMAILEINSHLLNEA